jgi:peptidoglycan/LPS O-acetylase OafA/YrhL
MAAIAPPFPFASPAKVDFMRRDLFARVQQASPRPVVTSDNARFYRPDLDLLRFFAFLLVFYGHALGHTRVGALGVPVFFLLSAYLITELLLRELDRTGSIEIKSFYMRRILRIWPLYFAVLVAGCCVAHAAEKNGFSFYAMVSYIFLCGNWYCVAHGYLPLGLGGLWSISVEEQFYLIWPNVVRLIRRNGLLWFSATLWAICQIIVVFLCLQGKTINPTIWTNSLSQFQYFAIGSMISVLLNRAVPRMSMALRVVVVLCGLGAFIWADRVFDTTGYGVASLRSTYPGYLLVGLGASLIFFGFLGTRVAAWMSPLVYLGKISYGLYIFHQIVILVVSKIPAGSFEHPIHAGIALAITIVMAALSYRYFETPFLRLKQRFEIVQSR